MNYFILLPIILPILAGTALLLLPQRVFAERKQLLTVTGIALAATALCVLPVLSGAAGSCTLFRITDRIPVHFAADRLGRLFAAVVTIVLVLAGFFSFSYMKHEENEKRYYGFYLITFGVLLGLDFSGNLITMYLFYEMMTLVSLPLVLHNGTKEAVMAGLKYLLYSMCGAYMALFGIYFLYQYTNTLEFTAGGSLNMAGIAAAGNASFLLVVAFLMILGFGVKAGMFPLHAWLPTAHPVAPAPASAVLSGIIVKGGVLAIIRVIYYIFGADFIRGTWVQTAWLILTLVTVLMGSALAYKEKVLKKRLAYSTVSNLSYILFGLALLHPIGMTGALLHVVFHAFIKSALFLCAGAMIVMTGKTKVSRLQGIGKQMPVLLWCYTIAALGLIGIPPASGVVSKWYLAIGALDTGIPVFSWLGPVILLLSALLTAGYLLPLSINGFLKEPLTALPRKEPSYWMLIPVILLAALTLLTGIYPAPIIDFISGIVSGLL